MNTRFVCAAFFVSLLSGCGGQDLADLQSWVVEVKNRPKGAIEPLPEFKTIEPFVFNAGAVRSPFEPVAEETTTDQPAATGGLRPDFDRPKEELEAYALDSLRMVGTVFQSDTLWGLVRANDGTIHRVRKDNYMGKNFGRIVRIAEDKIEVIEIIQDSTNAWRERPATLALAE
ncbi:MAG TPA: pilus assembly protein PilP [Methylococcaceae bacterium]|nr:pilus assembly protein PilP [Methylococcaceae bacterium]